MEKAQKEYYLNEKVKAIQKELGRKEDPGNEVDELRKKIKDGKMPSEVEKRRSKSSSGSNRCPRCRPRRRSHETTLTG